MLVLKRKKGQKLIINDNIEVIILEAGGESVKIGIRAPKNISIFREEIYDEIKKANLQSSKITDIEELNIAMNLLEKDKDKDKKFGYSKNFNSININAIIEGQKNFEK